MTRKALGRGLSALIPTAPAIPPATSALPAADGIPMKVAIEKIRANHLQPRRHFDAEALGELAASIKQHGLAQPIVVSFDAVSRSYELIAGERRWRATQLAGLNEIEVVVRTPRDDKQRLALTLIENLQREDLNPIEVALGYLRLMKEFGINQTELGGEVGKSKSGISNTLRLLEHPEEIRRPRPRPLDGHGSKPSSRRLQECAGRQAIRARNRGLGEASRGGRTSSRRHSGKKNRRAEARGSTRS